MKEKIIVGVVMVVLGGILGNVVKSYFDAGIPSIEILDVVLSESNATESHKIEIPEGIRKLSQKSTWFRTLEKYESLDQLAEEVAELREIVDRERGLVTFIPQYKAFLESNNNEEQGNAGLYRRVIDYLARNSDEMTTLIVSLAGEISRGSIELRISDIAPDSGDEDQLRTVDNDGISMLLLAFFKGDTTWNVPLMQSLLDQLKAANNRDTINDIQLLEGLDEVMELSLSETQKKFLSIYMLFTNNGRSTITLDNNLAAKIETMEESPLFLEAKLDSDAIVIHPGESRIVPSVQFGFLNEKQFKTIEALFGNESFRLIVLGKVLAGETRNVKWVSTKPTQVGKNTELKMNKYFEKISKESFRP